MAETIATITVNFEQIKRGIRVAARDVINSTLSDAYSEAQRLVPVRKVFKGSRRVTGTRRARPLTREEAFAERAVRQQLNAGLGKGDTRRIPQTIREIRQTQTLREPTRQAQVPSNPFLRVPRRIRRPDDKYNPDPRVVRERSGAYQLANPHPDLDARGRYELRVGRAVSRADLPQRAGNIRRPGMAQARATLGGRLKREIEIHEARASAGSHIEGSLVSPTYYARFVEFGTRHAAAQPYMRPALAKVRETFRTRMAEEIRSRGVPKRKHVRTGRPAFGRGA